MRNKRKKCTLFYGIILHHERNLVQGPLRLSSFIVNSTAPLHRNTGHNTAQVFARVFAADTCICNYLLVNMSYVYTLYQARS